MPWLVTGATVDEPHAPSHAMPMKDVHEHVPSLECWCRPQPDENIIEHIPMDGRETFSEVMSEMLDNASPQLIQQLDAVAAQSKKTLQ